MAQRKTDPPTETAPPSIPSRQEQIEALGLRLRARQGIIVIETYEEHRFLEMIRELQATDSRHERKRLYFWSVTEGLRQVAGPGLEGLEAVTIEQGASPTDVLDRIEEQLRHRQNPNDPQEIPEPAIYVLRDFHPYLFDYGQESPRMVRRIRDIAALLNCSHSNLIFVSPFWPELPSLEKDLVRAELPLPQEDEIGSIVKHYLTGMAQIPKLTVTPTPAVRTAITQGLLGLTELDFRRTLNVAVLQHGGVTEQNLDQVLAVIRQSKAELVRKSGALSYLEPEPLSSLGGNQAIREYLEELRLVTDEGFHEFGGDPPRGMFLLGVPGCGKDLIKTVVASILNRVLLSLNVGALFETGLIGSGAKSLKEVKAIVSVLRCVLGISEYEKAMAGLGASGRTDGGEVSRTFGDLLDWMAKQSQAFLVATANDVTHLNPEQLRTGRFDRLFFIDLPTEAERADIFRVHLEKRGRQLEAQGLQALAEASAEMTGAEIEQVVKDTIRRVYAELRRRYPDATAAQLRADHPITTEQLLATIPTVHKIVDTKREDIDRLRDWAIRHRLITVNQPTIPPIRPSRLNGSYHLET